MGVGIVLGAAFSEVIDSLVKDILLPPIGLNHLLSLNHFPFCSKTAQ